MRLKAARARVLSKIKEEADNGEPWMNPELIVGKGLRGGVYR